MEGRKEEFFQDELFGSECTEGTSWIVSELESSAPKWIVWGQIIYGFS